jgi:hypothetical protein
MRACPTLLLHARVLLFLLMYHSVEPMLASTLHRIGLNELPELVLAHSLTPALTSAAGISSAWLVCPDLFLVGGGAGINR